MLGPSMSFFGCLVVATLVVLGAATRTTTRAPLHCCVGAGGRSSRDAAGCRQVRCGATGLLSDCKPVVCLCSFILSAPPRMIRSLLLVGGARGRSVWPCRASHQVECAVWNAHARALSALVILRVQGLRGVARNEAVCQPRHATMLILIHCPQRSAQFAACCPRLAEIPSFAHLLPHRMCSPGSRRQSDVMKL